MTPPSIQITEACFLGKLKILRPTADQDTVLRECVQILAAPHSAVRVPAVWHERVLWLKGKDLKILLCVCVPPKWGCVSVFVRSSPVKSMVRKAHTDVCTFDLLWLSF